ncbi:MAG: FtsQ-type POTRA domain-containing protein [Patescibacteria group bacterium]
MILKDFKQNIELKPKTSFFCRKKIKVNKDYAWQGTKINPYKKECDSEKKKFLFYVFIILFCVFITIFLAIFNPFFKISEININGLQRINNAEIKTVTFDLLNLKSFGFLPNDSYFRIKIDNIIEILKNRFPIEEITITKSFPNVLNIDIKEKITTIIYDNGKEYSFINLNGDIVEIFRKVASYEWQETIKINTSTDEFGKIIENKEVINKIHKPDIKSLINDMGNYPIVFDERQTDVEINKNVLNQNQARKIVDWFNLLNKNTDEINLKYFILNNSNDEVIIQTYDAWYIKTSVDREVENQYKELKTVLEKEIQNQNFSYIDLRYPNRIYWK